MGRVPSYVDWLCTVGLSSEKGTRSLWLSGCTGTAYSSDGIPRGGMAGLQRGLSKWGPSVRTFGREASLGLRCHAVHHGQVGRRGRRGYVFVCRSADRVVGRERVEVNEQ